MKRIVNAEMFILEGEAKLLSAQPNRLTIQGQVKEGIVYLELKGQMTSEMADDLVDELLAYLSAGLDLRLDFGDISYIAPAVIEKMIRMQLDYVEELGREMRLCHMPAFLIEWFKRNHYYQQFDIERGAEA